MLQCHHRMSWQQLKVSITHKVVSAQILPRYNTGIAGIAKCQQRLLKMWLYKSCIGWYCKVSELGLIRGWLEVNSGKCFNALQIFTQKGIIYIIGIVLYYKVSQHRFWLNSIADWLHGIAKCHSTGTGCRYQSQPMWWDLLLVLVLVLVLGIIAWYCKVSQHRDWL